MDIRGTMVSSVLCPSKSVLNGSNSNRPVNNAQTISFNGHALNGNIFNGHAANGLSTNSILKPTKRIIVQNSPNGLVLSSITTTSNVYSQTKSSSSSSINGVIERDTGHLNSSSSILPEVISSSEKMYDVVTLSDSEDVKEEEVKDEEPVIDIVINNVVCSFSVGCHLNLRHIALTAKNVEYRRENGMVTMKVRHPLVTASVWSSGKITCTGSTSEDESRRAARRVARCIQKLGYNVKFKNYRIVNVLGTCTMPFAIKIAQFSQSHRKEASYEPELHPGVTFRIPIPKATLKVFSTGSITVTAPSVTNVQKAIEHIYPLVSEWSKPKTVVDVSEPIKPEPVHSLDSNSEEEVQVLDDSFESDSDF